MPDSVIRVTLPFKYTPRTPRQFTDLWYDISFLEETMEWLI